MTHLRIRAARRLAAVLVFIVIGSAAITACTPGTQQAQDLVRRHLDLIATAGVDELQELWETTATDDPDLVRAAGDLLPGATERITVVEVGTVSRHEGSVDLPSGSDLDTGSVLQVEVRYALAGTEHDGIVLVAPRADAPGTWQVVRPLMGELAVAPAELAELQADVFVSDIRVNADRELWGDGLDLYPGTYLTQQRGDPYLASEEKPVTLTAGSRATLPELPMSATDATLKHVTVEAGKAFAECEKRPYRCPERIRDLVRAHDSEAYRAETWTFDLTTSPQGWRIDRGLLRFSGGRFTLHFADGSTIRAEFSGTVPWVIDNQSWTPAVLATRMEIEVTS